MPTFMTWATNDYEQVPLRCHLFGHKWVSGWYGSVPYLSVGNTVIDNLSEKHIDLECECARCGERTVVGRIHASAVMEKILDHQSRGMNMRHYEVLRR